MTDARKFIQELRETKPGFKEAQEVVDAVRNVSSMLRRMRDRKGFTQADLAKRLGLSPGRVSQLESGTLRDAPSLQTLMRFAQACGETIAIVPSGERPQAAKLTGMRDFAAQLGELRADVANLVRQLSLYYRGRKATAAPPARPSKPAREKELEGTSAR